MKKIQKDLILLFGTIFAAFILWLVPILLNSSPPDMVKVMQDGQVTGRYSLLKEQAVSIPWGEENYNLMLISGGQVSVSDADCPDKLCVRQRAIARSGESIICLPHKLVIQIESKEDSELDAVTY